MRDKKKSSEVKYKGLSDYRRSGLNKTEVDLNVFDKSFAYVIVFLFPHFGHLVAICVADTSVIWAILRQ